MFHHHHQPPSQQAQQQGLRCICTSSSRYFFFLFLFLILTIIYRLLVRWAPHHHQHHQVAMSHTTTMKYHDHGNCYLNHHTMRIRTGTRTMGMVGTTSRMGQLQGLRYGIFFVFYAYNYLLMSRSLPLPQLHQQQQHAWKKAQMMVSSFGHY